MIHSVRAFWWTGVPNFGDAITPIILSEIAGLSVELSDAKSAEIVCTGSILGMLPPEWSGIVVGAGYARRFGQYVDVPTPLSRADVRAVRGRATAAQLPYMRMETAPYYGDPGLLAQLLVGDVPIEHELGVVAHWQDRSLESARGLKINVRDEPLKVIRQIASCEKILASSLHGIIVADAFGRERKWHRFNLVQGGGFKFFDYGTTVGMIEPELWGRADPAKVKKLQEDLVYVLKGL